MYKYKFYMEENATVYDYCRRNLLAATIYTARTFSCGVEGKVVVVEVISDEKPFGWAKAFAEGLCRAANLPVVSITAEKLRSLCVLGTGGD